MDEKYTLEEIKNALYQIDWINVLQDAVESRPSSWGVKRGEEYAAVDEWRNASDTLIPPVNKKLEAKLVSFGETDR